MRNRETGQPVDQDSLQGKVSEFKQIEMFLANKD
jgi:hypothetical protein